MSHEMRWTNKHPGLSKILKAFFDLPEEIQTVLANTFSKVLERIEFANPLESSPSIGVEKLKHIYKSKQRKRSYDKIPEVHRMMNFLALLNEEDYDVILEELEPLVAIGSACKARGEKFLSKPFVENCLKQYFETDLDGALQFIAGHKNPDQVILVDGTATRLVSKTPEWID